MKKERGFTIIELMVTLVIAGILMGLAVPAFNTTIRSNRMATQANLLIGSLNIARSEAVKAGRTATVCVSSDQASCTGETDWALGWLVWVDDNGDNLLTANEERRFNPNLPANMTFASAVSQVQYSAQGAANAAALMTLCDDRVGETGRQLNIANTGRVNVSNFVCP